MLLFIVGVLVGGAVGFAACAICHIAGENDVCEEEKGAENDQ